MRCIFHRTYKTPKGEKKVRCQYDGSIRNQCKYGCPHYRRRTIAEIINAWREREW